MKRYSLSFILLIVAICCFAAITQTGYVKTRGRLDGKGKVIPGQRLGNVTIILQNNSSVVSNRTGDFTLSLPSSKYYLKNVKKVGYIVSDPDILTKQYAYSTNPLILVMDEPNVQQDDKLESERKLRRNLQKQLQKREDELEVLKEENKITQEQYREALQKLYSDQESNEKFIAEMADRYSRIDFDQLDAFQRRMATFIQDGELVKADSLLRTKGSMDDREAELTRLRKANEEERKELARREANLSNSEKNEAVLLADFGADCYNHYELCKLRFDNDSAAYWLERRAKADSTNGLWHRELAKFLYENLADYSKSWDYYQTALRIANEQNGEKSEEASICLSGLGNIASLTSNYDQALRFYDAAIEIDTLLYGNNSTAVCFNYINKGYIYGEIAENVKAIEYYNKVINIFEANGISTHQSLATAYSNLASVYANMKQMTTAIDLTEKALDIRLKIFEPENSHDIASSYSNLGLLYGQTGDIEKGLEYLLRANDIFHKIYNEDHPTIASVYNNIGSLLDENDCQGASEYYMKALAIRELLFGKDSPHCAIIHNNIGNFYYRTKEYEKSIDSFKTALKLYKTYLGETHPNIALFYYNIANAYDRINKNDEAIESYLQAAAIYEENYGEESLDAAECYYEIGSLYLYKRSFPEALNFTRKAIALQSKHFGFDNRVTMKSIAQEGIIYNHMSQYKEAYDMLLRAYKFFSSEEGLDENRSALINNYIYISLINAVNEQSIGRDILQEYLQNNIISIYVVAGESPASKQGLIGEYYLLQYNTWNLESFENLYDLKDSLNGCPKSITIMQNGAISHHDFDDKIGCGFVITQIDPDEKVKIIDKYHQWVSHNQ